MQTHKLHQGSPDWHAHRAQHFNASDAPAMMACSPYLTRTDLIRKIATGLTADVSAATQRIFDAGHSFEALARPLAEEIIGDDLYPVTGTSGKYSASFDGLTMDGTTAFEHKTLNDDLRNCMRDEGNGYDLPKHYQVQMEQQLMVSGAERVLFMASKWDGETLLEKRHCWYASDPKLRAGIVAGWAQLEADVAAYVPVAKVAAPVAAPVQSLPALVIRVEGRVVSSNLDAFREVAIARIDAVKTKLESDQDFADAEATIKAFKEGADSLKQTKVAAQAEASSIDEVFRAVDFIVGLLDSKRLELDRLVKAEKERRRTDIVTSAGAALRQHVDGLNTRLGKPYMPPVYADFGAAIKGMKKIESMQDAVDALLANSKIAANETADRIQANLTTLRTLAKDHPFLFADAPQLVLKANDDLTNLVNNRIAEHQRQEEAKAEELRARIRREEEQRAQQQERARQAELQRQAAAEESQRQAAARQEAIDAEKVAQAGIAEARAVGALPAVLLDDLAGVAAHVRDSTVAVIDAGHVIATAQRPSAPTPAVDDTGPATLLIGAINTRLGYVVSAAFLAELGFEPARIEGARRFYRDSDLPRIGRAIAEHTIRATQLQTA